MERPTKAAILLILHKLVESINKMPDHEFQKLIGLDEDRNQDEKRPIGPKDDVIPISDQKYIQETIAGVSGAEGTLQALKYIESRELTKRELTVICKQFEIRVLSSDNVNRLEHKVVDFLIANRLNSEAIRGRP